MGLAFLYGCGAHGESSDDALAALGVADEFRERVLVIQSAARHGLDPADYGLASLAGLPTRDESGTAEWARADSVLDDGVRRLQRDLLLGAAPESLRDDHPNDAPVTATGPDDLLPESEEYGRLVEWLETYRAAVDRGGWGTVRLAGESVKPGMSRDEVPAIRARLRASLDPEERALAERSGADTLRARELDRELAAAVARFQERHGLTPDSVVGEKTATAMSVPPQERVRQIVATMERWRWLPRDFGRHGVWVNIPSYDLVVMDEGRERIRMRVMVGLPDWQTPSLSDTLESVVVNPYWNVPSSILADEILPAQRADPTYLARRNYEVLGPGDVVVPPEFVDWWSMDPERTPYRIRQRPGPGNALGKVKFLFPNRHHVYLHDTPVSDELFGLDERALSHGCVRVERPRELAEVLADMGGMDWGRVRAALAGTETTAFRIERPIPVTLTYFTVRAEGPGAPSFHRDVYKRDEVVARTVVAAQ